MATAKKKAAKKKTAPAKKSKAAAAARAGGAAARPARPAGDGAIFGPEFFGAVLPRMVSACPCPEDREPVCIVHLADGTDLDVVEVLAVADRFVLLAVFEGTGEDGVARTEDDVGVEAVPYELVLRVSVRRTTRRVRLGFHLDRDALVAATAEADGAARKSGKGVRRGSARRASAAETTEVEAATAS